MLSATLCYAQQQGSTDQDFTATEIPDNVWARMQGKTYKENPHIGRDDLRYLRLLHWDYDGKTHRGEMVCNKLIADRVVEIFRLLYEAHYPIERIVLPDEYDADDERQMRANNTSSFCYRAIAGSNKLSKHARGLAVDLNTLYNPYYKDRKDGTRFVQPATATAYCDRTKSFRYKIDHNDLAFRLFTERGFEWGGDWTSCKDFQHFELKDEYCVTENNNQKPKTTMKNFGSKPWMLPQPVLIIGTYNKEGKPNAMNAAWGGTWDMHEIVISLSSHQTTDNLKVNNEFTVAFATTETLVAADYVGLVSGRNTPDKMERTGWTIEKAPNVNAPLFKEMPMTMECRVKQKIDESESGYYLVAEVVNIVCDERYLAADGQPDVEKMHIISYDPVHHNYIEMGKAVGKAFADGKKLK